MSEKPTEAIYKKVGRKYVPVSARWHEDSSTDSMTAGTFRLTYAHKDGCRRFEYDVTPATAPAAAAMMIAKTSIEESLRRECSMRPSGQQAYTKKQMALIEQFKKDMDGFYPSHWTEQSAHTISDAAIKAVMEFKP